MAQDPNAPSKAGPNNLGRLDEHDAGDARQGLEFSVEATPRALSMPAMLPRQTRRNTSFGRPMRVKVCPIITRTPLPCKPHSIFNELLPPDRRDWAGRSVSTCQSSIFCGRSRAVAALLPLAGRMPPPQRGRGKPNELDRFRRLEDVDRQRSGRANRFVLAFEFLDLKHEGRSFSWERLDLACGVEDRPGSVGFLAWNSLSDESAPIALHAFGKHPLARVEPRRVRHANGRRRLFRVRRLMDTSFARHQFPPDIIGTPCGCILASPSASAMPRFAVERGLNVSHETIG